MSPADRAARGGEDVIAPSASRAAPKAARGAALDQDRVAPDLVPYLATLETVDLDDLGSVRRGTEVDVLAWDAAVRIRHVVIPGRGEAPSVRVQLYDGRTSERDQCGIVHVHGGGFVSGDTHFEHRRSLELARGGRCLVASVEYRLAPEHRYPAGFEDCCSVLDWLHHNAGELGLAARRIGVAGSSAGGCIAAALAMRARDAGTSPIAFQILVYPVLDCRPGSRSVAQFADVPGFCGRNVAQMWAHYLGGRAPDAYAAPALASDLSGLPPAFVSVAELDPLRDEAIDYAKRMLDGGVPVELRVFPGTWHGFDLVAPESATARAFNGAEVEALRRLVGWAR